MTMQVGDAAWQHQFVEPVQALDLSPPNPMLEYAANTAVKLRHDRSDVGLALCTGITDYWPGHCPGTIKSWRNRADCAPDILWQISSHDTETECGSSSIFSAIYRAKDMRTLIGPHVERIEQRLDCPRPDAAADTAAYASYSATILSQFMPLTIHEFIKLDGSVLTTDITLLWFDASYRRVRVRLDIDTFKLYNIFDHSRDRYPHVAHHIFPQFLQTFMQIINVPAMADYYGIL